MNSHLYGDILQFSHPTTGRLVRRGVKKLSYTPGAIERLRHDLDILLKERCERIEDAPKEALCRDAYDAYFKPIYGRNWPRIWKRFSQSKFAYREVVQVFRLTPAQRITQLEEKLRAAQARIEELEAKLAANSKPSKPRISKSDA